MCLSRFDRYLTNEKSLNNDYIDASGTQVQLMKSTSILETHSADILSEGEVK